MILDRPIPETPVGDVVNVAVKGAVGKGLTCAWCGQDIFWGFPRPDDPCPECERPVSGPPPELVALDGAKCETCGGDQWINVKHPNEMHGGMVYTSVICPDCHGTGLPLVELQWVPECEGGCDRRGSALHPYCLAQGHGSTVTADGLWRLTGLWLVVGEVFTTDWPRGQETPYVRANDGCAFLHVESHDEYERITVVGTPVPGGWVARWERIA